MLSNAQKTEGQGLLHALVQQHMSIVLRACGRHGVQQSVVVRAVGQDGAAQVEDRLLEQAGLDEVEAEYGSGRILGVLNQNSP